MSEAVNRVARGDLIQDGLHGGPQRINGPAGQASQQLLDLAEDHLDRVQVGAVGRQEDQLEHLAHSCFVPT